MTSTNLVHSGFHYVYSSPTDVMLMFYDEANDKDYPVRTCKDLSQADELIYFLQNSYIRIYQREGGVRQ